MGTDGYFEQAVSQATETPNASFFPDQSFPWRDARLAMLMTRAQELNALSYSPEKGVCKQLESAIESEMDASKKQRMSDLLNEFQTYFGTDNQTEVPHQNGQVHVRVSDDGLTASIIIIPPQGQGYAPTLSDILEALESADVIYGIDMDAIQRALEVVNEQRDIAWQVAVAHGEPPKPGKSTHIQFRVRYIDKAELRRDNTKLSEQFQTLWKPVKEGDVIGLIKEPILGRDGKDVRGNTIFAQKVERRRFTVGEQVILSHNVLSAKSTGYVVVEDQNVEITPVYTAENPPPGAFDDFSYPGSVVIHGNLAGPGSIQCKDLFVLGNCEQCSVFAEGDLFVLGGIMGHRQSVMDVEGGIYASFVSDATVTALGEIVVANIIINSRVTGNDCIKVLSRKGMITGGSTRALKEITAPKIGSEFGMLTEVVAGKDYLTELRLAHTLETIKIHEQNLSKIQELKAELNRARIRLEQLPPNKQEIYVGVLQKEAQSRSELRRLLQKKNTLPHTAKDFPSACIRVLNDTFPPIRVQILDEITAVTKQLNAVALRYDPQKGGIGVFPDTNTEVIV